MRCLRRPVSGFSALLRPTRRRAMGTQGPRLLVTGAIAFIGFGLLMLRRIKVQEAALGRR